MISGATSDCYNYQTMSHQQHQGNLQIYSMSADHNHQDPHHHVNSSSFSFEPNASSSSSVPSDHQSQSTYLLYNLSILKEKVQQARSLVTILISPSDHHQSHQQQPHPESTTLAAIASMNNVIQEIIVTASSMMFTCQQIVPVDRGLPLADPNRLSSQQDVKNIPRTERGQQQQQEAAADFYSSTTDLHQTLDWFSENYNDCTTTSKSTITINRSSSNNRVQNLGENKELPLSNNGLQSISLPNNNNCDIIELEAKDLLAKYTHYCQVCAKGFKRDANLRMHMRAHGDEYKTNVALSNPMKHNNINSMSASDKSESLTKVVPRKYSCPQQGCRWNQKHDKFQPLKSIICVKNHYKRSHCAKMYVCKRCNRKQFSVLSDLRTHEKHCGDLRWQCSCGTTFSRKDKLMGHVALFHGHTPVSINSSMRAGKAEVQASHQIIRR